MPAGRRFLVVSNLYPPHILGGCELLCANVCEELVRRGHAVTVLTSTHGLASTAVPEPEHRHGVAVRRELALFTPFGQPPVMHRRVRLATSARNAAPLERALVDVRPDVVFFWSQLRLTMALARHVQAAGIPTAWTINDDTLAGHAPASFTWHPRGFLRFVFDRTLHRAATLHGVHLRHATSISAYIRDLLVQQGVPVGGARIIRQGIDLVTHPCKSAPGVLATPARLLYLGRLHPQKGVHTLIAATRLLAAQLGRDAFTLTVIGSGDPAYEAQLRAGADADLVRFRGAIPPDEVAAAHRTHDVFVFPVEGREGFGLALLEAMAAGTPVVTTTAGGHGEFVAEGRNALTFPAGDAAALATTIARLLRDPPLAVRLATTARQDVERGFAFPTYVDQLEQLLSEAMANPCG